jgi:hypothetical protein
MIFISTGYYFEFGGCKLTQFFCILNFFEYKENGPSRSLQTQTISKQNSVEVKIMELKLLKNYLKSKILIFTP